MNRTFLGTHRWPAWTAASRWQHAWVTSLALVGLVLMCAGSGIAAGQTLEDTVEDGTAADGETCMADDAFVPLDPIGDPEQTAGEADLDTGVFDSPLDSPETVTEAAEQIEPVDGSEQGFSLIPEPGTLLTLALAALMLLLLRRKW